MGKVFFQQISIIWFALIFGQILFLLFFVLVFKEAFNDSGLKGFIEYPAAFFFVVTILASQFMYGQLLAKGKKDTLEQKLSTYRSANLMKAALLESGNLFCIVAYSLTEAQFLLVFIMGVLVWMYLQKPSPEKLETEMELSYEEKQQLGSF